MANEPHFDASSVYPDEWKDAALAANPIHHPACGMGLPSDHQEIRPLKSRHSLSFQRCMQKENAL
jgi:hypothetical protein